MHRTRILVLWAGLVFSPVGSLVAQQAGQAGPAQEPGGNLLPWKIANTLIFAALVGYFLYRSAPRFFNARSADIQKAIQDATGLKMQADLRYSEIDRKMAALADEVKKLREQSATEIEREHQRMQTETREELKRIEHNLAEEVEAFRQRGVRTLREQTAAAAMELATRRLQERVGQNEAEDSVQEFIHLVERGKN